MLAERWITLLGMADRAAVKAVNRSDLWHPYGHLKQREMQLLVHSPLIMINGNFEREKKTAKLSGFVSIFDITSCSFVSFFFCSVKDYFIFLSKTTWIKILYKSILTGFVKEMEIADKMYE